jgi:hypothetical protein
MDLSLSHNENIQISKNGFTNLHDIIEMSNLDELKYIIYITNKPDKEQYCSYITLKDMVMSNTLFSVSIQITEEDNYEGPFPYTFTLNWDTSNDTYDIIADKKYSYSPTCLIDDRYNEGIYNVEKLIPILFCNYPTFSEGNYNLS